MEGHPQTWLLKYEPEAWGGYAFGDDLFGHPGNGYGWTNTINTFAGLTGIFVPNISDNPYFGRNVIQLFGYFFTNTGFKASTGSLSFLFWEFMDNIYPRPLM